MVDPAVRPIWLDNVVRDAVADRSDPAGSPRPDLRPRRFRLRRSAAAADASRARKTSIANSAGSPPLAALLMAVAYMVAAARGSSYAIWLGMPFVAAAMWKLFALFKLEQSRRAFRAALFVTPTALTLGAITLASAAGQPELANLNPPERAGCTAKPNYAGARELPVRGEWRSTIWNGAPICWHGRRIRSWPPPITGSRHPSCCRTGFSRSRRRRPALSRRKPGVDLYRPVRTARDRRAFRASSVRPASGPSAIRPRAGLARAGPEQDEASGFRVWRVKR